MGENRIHYFKCGRGESSAYSNLSKKGITHGQNGFKKKIPDYLISIQNGEYEELSRYQDIASFMKELEMEPPEEIVKLNLKFEGNGENGTNS